MSNPLVLFGTPVYSYDKYIGSSIHDISDVGEIGFLENTGKNLVSKHQNVLELNNYKSIKYRILEGLEEYTRNILCVDDIIEFYIIQSWMNINPPGTHHHRHWHPNSLISGVYYIDVDEEANITFISSSTDLSYGCVGYDLPRREYNIHNSLSWFYKVQSNQAIYFPSSLQHEVVTNESTTDRISLSFNVLFKTQQEEMIYDNRKFNRPN